MRGRTRHWCFSFGLLLATPVLALGQVAATSHHFRTSDGVELHYLEAGSGPLMVFVPGWTMPAAIWEPQIAHFSSSHRVIALDPRGQGHSEKVAYGYHSARRAQDIGELLEHLDGDPAVLVGWSLGVHEVLRYTEQAGTNRVAGVVLVDHAIAADWSTASFMKERYGAVQVDREAWVSAFVRAIFATPQPEEYLDGITQAALGTPTNATAIMIGNLVLMDTGDLMSAVEQIDKPVLFIWIEGRGEEWMESARRLRPNAQVVVVPNAGHAVFVDQPGIFNEAVETFLRREIRR